MAGARPPSLISEVTPEVETPVAAKVIAVALSTALIVLAAAALLLFMMVVGMNGVQERKASPIFIGYFAMTAAVVAISSALSGWGSRKLAARMEWPMLAAGPLSVMAMSAAGALALVGGCFLLLVIGTA
jgi:hypothetical protein